MDENIVCWRNLSTNFTQKVYVLNAFEGQSLGWTEETYPIGEPLSPMNPVYEEIED